MAKAVLTAGSPAAARPAISLGKRIVNAIIRNRLEEAESELRRHKDLFENARIHGSYSRVGLHSADLLPFNR
jgi:hypothetical protein